MSIGNIARYLLRFYSTKKLFRYFGTMGRRMSFMREAVTMFFCIRDARTPLFVRVVLIGAIGYLLTPVDLVPDVLVGLGWLVDTAVSAAAMRLARAYIQPEHVMAAKRFFPF